MKISRAVREIINIIVFLLIVGTLITFYAIYPLNATKTSMARPDIDEYEQDSTIINEPGIYTEFGFNFGDDTTGIPLSDTFWVESDGLTSLACLYLVPELDSNSSIKGTVSLLHDDNQSRDSIVEIARQFTENGYGVIVYDQRASGKSSGKYRGDGQYEATDFQEVIRYMDIRGKIIHPFIVVGYSLGADAALLCATEESRIDGVIAINPYLSSTRLLDLLKEKHGHLWFPFYRTIMWWWYGINSSYAASYRELEDIQPAACKTLLVVDPEKANDEEILKFKELSAPNLLEIKTESISKDNLLTEVEKLISTL